MAKDVLSIHGSGEQQISLLYMKNEDMQMTDKSTERLSVGAMIAHAGLALVVCVGGFFALKFLLIEVLKYLMRNVN